MENRVIRAAAEGVGQILIQICKIYGARVIALVSSENKKQIASSLGADAVFLYKEDWKEKILGLKPSGVDVVFDSIGFPIQKSLEVTPRCYSNRDIGRRLLTGQTCSCRCPMALQT